MRVRELKDPQTGKTWGTRCDHAKVIIRAGMPGKEKDSVKPQNSAEEAIAWAEKEEWGRLKKGFILEDPEAKPGAPRMHRYRGLRYTGALPILDVEGRLLCNSYDDTRPGDKLFLLDEYGVLSSLPEFPRNRLAWKACYLPSLNRLLVRADHQVLSWMSGEVGFQELSSPNRHPVSCLDTVGTRAVWYAEPDLVVTDLATGRTLLRQRLEFETYGGHSPQMEAALSPDGATVACCSHTGEIAFWDVATGQTRATLSGGFKMVIGLTYTPDGRFLIVSEQYGESRNLCFDLSTMAPRPGWIASKNGGTISLALSPDGTRMAMVQGRNIEVFDFATLKSQLCFRVEHMVKRCTIAWVGRWLGVQTDYGCASLYALT